MTYNRWGMHGPNKKPTRISTMVAMGMDCYTVVDLWEQVRQIRSARPNAIILLRPYFTGGMNNVPEEVAERACDHALQFMDVTRHVVIGNELNIEGEFDATDPDEWKRMNEWVLRTAAVVRRNLPEAVLHFPGVSPGVGDDPDIMDPPGLEYCREAVEECDVLDQHVYWPGRDAPAWAWEVRFEEFYGRRLKWHHDLFPDKWIFLSECGPTDVRPAGTAEDIIEWFGILEREFPYWLGSALFMWNWGEGQDYLNYYNKPWLTEALRMAPKKLFEMPTSWVYEESPSPPPPPEGDIGEWLLEDLDKFLPPWGEPIGYNPDTALARAARLAKPPLGLPFSKELRKPRDGRVVVYQYFWRGLAWCWDKAYEEIWIKRY